MALPPLPAGFEVENQSAPPLPAGFELEGAAPEDSRTILGTVAAGIKAAGAGAIGTMANVIDPTPMFGMEKVYNPIRPDLEKTKTAAAQVVDKQRAQYAPGFAGQATGALTEIAANPLNYVGGSGKALVSGAEQAAVGLGKRLIGSGLTGTASGFIQGVGEGDSRNLNAGVGAVAGPVLTAAGQVVKSTASAGKSAVGAVANALRKPEAAAATYITGLNAANVAEKASVVQKVLNGSHEAASKVEDAAWSKLRADVADKAIATKEAKPLMDKLIEVQGNTLNNDSAGVIGRQLERLNRFVGNNLSIPAAELVGIRRTLSKASVRDAGLRDAVSYVDGILKNRLDVPSLETALNASKDKFARFDDQATVAKLIAGETTAASAGKVINPANAQAANNFKQVVGALTDEADVAQAKLTMQQGVASSLVQDAISSSDSAGGLIVSKNTLASNIAKLRNNNPELWGLLETKQRQALANLETGLRKGQNNPVSLLGNFAVKWGLRGTGLGELVPRVGVDDGVALKHITDMLQARPTAAAKPFVAPAATGAAATALVPKGQPVSPIAVPAAPAPAANDNSPAVPEHVIDRIIGIESGGRADAQNPNSSARGAGQFIKGTWLSLMKGEPEAEGKTPREILALRDDRRISRRMVEKYAGLNSDVLAKRGVEVSPATIYLSHLFDAPVAAKLAKADPSTPVLKIVGMNAVKANPNILKGRNVREVLAWADRKTRA
ncbi:hypothetical protein [Mesorhizobium sp.]|uniref:hypothetical protein n=1 Tax=Mesorhizobium sp. TaxID=1871066 RepID=UPI000FE495F8|nr:hypothetical protein [Mesorhizobium sp.]RWE44237.1 MAG: hypothetical protein EOS80_20060 [Mesorhizobium sp.]